MQTLAIIPARGGSKGINRKNIVHLNGKPLIAYTIESAREARSISRVIVSSDDEEIASIARALGAEVPFIRPGGLALDDTPTVAVLQHTISWLESAEGFIPDFVVTLQPTSPLRRAEHINEALSVLLDTGAHSVVSVCPVEHSPYWMMKLEGSRVNWLLGSVPEWSRRQDLSPVYRLNGAIHATRSEVVMGENKIFGDDTRVIVMDTESSIDIDTPHDLKIAEMILRERESICR